MVAKSQERKDAVLLRKKGYSYSEIANLLPVSRSILSLWLRNIVLDKRHAKLLSNKQRRGQLKGALKRKNERKKQEEAILREAANDVGLLSEKELWLIGIIAYWCEGAKQKENNVSQGVVFSNSDPLLIRLFVKWLRDICKISEEDIKYS